MVQDEKLSTFNTIVIKDIEAVGTTVASMNTAKGPTGIGTGAVSNWMKVTYAGTVYYIPMWT